MNRHDRRGTKRHCQNEQCALPFYDLNRVELACPNCGTAFVEKIVPAISTKPSWRSNSRFGQGRRDKVPVEHPPAPASDTVVEDVEEEADIEATTEADVLLDTDDEEQDVADPS